MMGKGKGGYGLSPAAKKKAMKTASVTTKKKKPAMKRKK